MKDIPAPSEYERKVKAAINDITASFKAYLNIKESYSADVGWTWSISPKNPRAADIYVYGVNENTINLAVDNLYWLELFVDEEEYQNDTPYFSQHLSAILKGKVKGWHVKGKRDLEELSLKTVLEIETDGSKPYQWSGNVIFVKRFKARDDTIAQSFESYR